MLTLSSSLVLSNRFTSDISVSILRAFYKFIHCNFMNCTKNSSYCLRYNSQISTVTQTSWLLTFHNITLCYAKVPGYPWAVVLETDDSHAGHRHGALRCAVTVGCTDPRAVTDDVTSVSQTLVCRQRKATPVVHMSPLTYGHTCPTQPQEDMPHHSLCTSHRSWTITFRNRLYSLTLSILQPAEHYLIWPPRMSVFLFYYCHLQDQKSINIA